MKKNKNVIMFRNVIKQYYVDSINAIENVTDRELLFNLNDFRFKDQCLNMHWTLQQQGLIDNRDCELLFRYMLLCSDVRHKKALARFKELAEI